MRARYDAATKNRDLVIALARQNVSLSEIGRRVGTNKRFVRRLLVDEGIALPVQRLDMEHNPHWKGGQMIDRDGYVWLKMPGHHLANIHGYVPAHRLLAEQMLGRPLAKSEVVHHRDGLPSNNSPDNLVVYPANSAHLAETLLGKCPNWTPEGRQRTLEGARRPRRKRASSQSAPTEHGEPTQ